MPKRDRDGRLHGDYWAEVEDKGVQRSQLQEIFAKDQARLTERLKPKRENVAYWREKIDDALQLMNTLIDNAKRYQGYIEQIEKGLEDEATGEVAGDEAGAVEARTELDEPSEL
jgi:hypothetical protein